MRTLSLITLCIISSLVYPATNESPFSGQRTSEIGIIYNNATLKHRFKWINTGTTKIQKIKANTSCGCTTVTTSSDVTNPEDSLFVDIEVDLEGKQGPITKTIAVTFQYNNKTYTDMYQLTFTAKKDSTEHNIQQYSEKIFGPKCGACHAAPAKNQYGKALFSEVCGFCHGNNAQGGMATGFTRLSYLKNLNRSHVMRIINEGSDDGLMPGFASKNGGPLNPEQVESLVLYLESLRKKWQNYF